MQIAHKKIFGTPQLALIGGVEAKPLDYTEHGAILEARVEHLAYVSDVDTRQAACDLLKVDFEKTDSPSQVANHIMASDAMTSFLDDIRHNWMQVTKEEIQNYYSALEAAKKSRPKGARFADTTTSIPNHMESVDKEEWESMGLLEFCERLRSWYLD